MGRKKCPHVDIVDQDQCTGSRACMPGGGCACGDNDGGDNAGGGGKLFSDYVESVLNLKIFSCYNIFIF